VKGWLGQQASQPGQRGSEAAPASVMTATGLATAASAED
jgi:hypothetical protein